MGNFDAGTFTAETGVQTERYPMDGCPRNRRGGKVEHPFAGCSVWLTHSTPLKLTTAATDLQVADRNSEAGRIGFRKLSEGLSEVVCGHDLPGYPQLWGNPAAVEELPAEVVFYIYQVILTGETPGAEGNASPAGAAGAGTPASMAIVETTQS